MRLIIPFLTTMFSRPFDMRGYLAAFGVSPHETDILCGVLEDDSISNFKFQRKHLMWALHFLKAYPTVDVLALKFKVASHTMVDWVWRVIDHLLEGLDEI